MDKGLEKKINVDSTTLKLLYEHYKDFLLPLGVIIISILLFLFFVIPEINYYFASKEQERIETEKLTRLQNNLNVLTSLDDATLDKNLDILIKALPDNKDFAGVVNSISETALKTGVSVGDFEFQVGDLSKASSVTSFPSLQVDIALNGNINSVIDYINELYNSAPVSEVSTFKLGQTGGILTSFFYYKPFSGAIISEETPVAVISASDNSFISKISTWNNLSGLSLPPIPIDQEPQASSESAQTQGQQSGSPF